MKALRLVILVIVLCMDHGHCGRILMLPVPLSKSHYSYFMSLASELLERGHDVDIAVTESMKSLSKIESEKLQYVTYHLPPAVDMETLHEDIIKTTFDNSGNIFKLLTATTITNVITTMCNSMLQHNEQFVQFLLSKDYDIAVLDATLFTGCMYFLPHRLGIPFVSVVDFFEPWPSRMPLLPSTVPSVMLPFSDVMTFRERLFNSFVHLLMAIVPMHPSLSGDIVERYMKYGDFGSLGSLMGKSQLWLYTGDVVLGYPDPLLPNVVAVGGLTTKPAKPLKQDILNMLESSGKGFILVSFGSVASVFPPHIASELLATFGQLDMQVIWRFKNKDNLDIPKNVMIMDWLPQNDLLGHKDIKLFISHCGRNGLFEALYHGVPVLGAPIFGDQDHNANIVASKGYGTYIDIFNIRADKLLSSIKEVLTSPKYKKNIQRASQIFHDRDHPTKRAARGLEHVMKFGGNHLRSSAYDLPWYQYLLIDVAVVILVVLTVFCLIMRKLCRCIKSRCCRRKTKTKLS